MYTKTEQFPLTMLIAKHLSVRQVIVQCAWQWFICVFCRCIYRVGRWALVPAQSVCIVNQEVPGVDTKFLKGGGGNKGSMCTFYHPAISIAGITCDLVSVHITVM